MAFQQLDPPLPVFVAGKGKGLAIGVVDHGPEHELIWVTALDDSGELVHAAHSAVSAGLDLSGSEADSDLFTSDSSHIRAFDFPEADAEHAAFP